MTNAEYLAHEIERFFGPEDVLTALVKEMQCKIKKHNAAMDYWHERHAKELFEVNLKLSLAKKALSRERRRTDLAILHSTDYFSDVESTCLALEAEERLRSFNHTVAPPEDPHNYLA